MVNSTELRMAEIENTQSQTVENRMHRTISDDDVQYRVVAIQIKFSFMFSIIKHCRRTCNYTRLRDIEEIISNHSRIGNFA